MKRLFLLSALFFLFFIFLVGFFTYNLTFFLNHSFFKERFQQFFSERFQAKISYQKVTVDLLKLHLTFQNFKVEHPDLLLNLPKGKVDFDWSKIFRGSFYPAELYLSSPQITLRIPKPKEEEVFDFRSFLKQLAPLKMVVKKGEFNLFYQEKAFKVKDLTFLLTDQRDQLLFEVSAAGNYFTKLSLKGWLNYQSLFGEGALHVEDLDLTKFLKGYGVELTESKLTLKAQISLEKDRLYVGFSGSAPCLVKIPEGSKIVCGFFTGQASLLPEGLEVELDSLDFKYPKTQGSLLITSKKEGVSLRAHLQSLSFDEVAPFLSALLPKEVSQDLLTIVKGGLFKDLTLNLQGKDWERALNLISLDLKSYVADGKVFIPETPLQFEEITGDILISKGRLEFTGSGQTSENILVSSAKVFLDLRKNIPSLECAASFSGQAENLHGLALNFWPNLAKFNLLTKGEVSGKLSLSGPVANLNLNLTLLPKDVSLTLSSLPKPINLKEGKIGFTNGLLTFENLKLNYETALLGRVSGLYNLNQGALTLKGQNLEIDKRVLHELTVFPKSLQERLSSLPFDFQSLLFKTFYLPEIKLKDLSAKEKLLPLLSLEGNIYGINGSLPIRNATLSLSSQEVYFNFNNGELFFTGNFSLEGSSFPLSGKVHLQTYEPLGGIIRLQGKGYVEEVLWNKISQTFQIPEALTVNLPAELSLEELALEGDRIFAKLKISSEETDLKVNINYHLTTKETKGDFLFVGPNSKFSTEFSLADPLKLKANGFLTIGDLRLLYPKFPVIKGSLEVASLSLSLPPNELELIKNKKEKIWEELPSLLGRKDIIAMEGRIEGKDLHLSKPLNGTFNLIVNLSPGKIDIPQFKVDKERINLEGHLEIFSEKDRLNLLGLLKAQSLDLNKIFNASAEKIGQKTSEEEISSLILGLPYFLDLKVELNEISLPSQHLIKGLNGKLSYSPEKGLSLVFPEIKFCDLNFYLEGEWVKDSHYVYGELLPSSGDLLDLFSCLYPTEMPRIIFEGPFKAKGFFFIEGGASFWEHSYGELEVSSQKGYMYRAPLLIRVLGFLSPIDLFRGKIPDLERTLLPYEELNLKAINENRTIKVGEFFLSAPGFRLFSTGETFLEDDKKINFTFLVSPFKTVDVILEHIPYFHKFLLGRERMFIYLPLQVVGTYDNPVIVPLHPASVGKGLFSFIFKFFGIKEDFFQKRPNFDIFRRKDVLQRGLGNPERR